MKPNRPFGLRILPARMEKKFLIIQTAFIGDVVLATPLIEKLHRFFPTASIDFLLLKGHESLLKDHPKLRKVITFDKKNNKYSQLIHLVRTIRSEQYDTVINVQRFFSSGFLTAFSGAKQTIGFDKNPWSAFFTRTVPHHISTTATGVHEVHRNLSLIESITDSTFVRPALYPSRMDYEKVRRQESYICIAPASVWYTKQWPTDRWIQLIQRLPESYSICLIGAKGDNALCENIRSAVGTSRRVENLSGQLSFLESAALMQHAAMNFVNDSAPLHFASAVNAPVCAVFCSTVPAFGFGPLSDISYVAETHHALDCRPCGLHGKAACPKGHFLCADINPESIVSLVGLDGK